MVILAVVPFAALETQTARAERDPYEVATFCVHAALPAGAACACCKASQTTTSRTSLRWKRLGVDWDALQQAQTGLR